MELSVGRGVERMAEFGLAVFVAHKGIEKIGVRMCKSNVVIIIGKTAY